jgi:glycosyltransferase involved in cell wall biosynthesis
MPSLAGEVFGLVALENMMRKKAVIISDIGALAEVVGDAGLVFPVGNAEILADRIKQVLQPGYAETLEERAGKRAKLFTTQRMAEEHRALYARVLHECSDSDQYSQEILSGVEAE